jgi:type IV pilus assembly protein PilM
VVAAATPPDPNRREPAPGAVPPADGAAAADPNPPATPDAVASDPNAVGGQTAADPAAAATAEAPAVEDTGPKGEGWVIELDGYHFHNKNSEGIAFVRDTLVRNLRDKVVTLVGADGKEEKLALKDLGIGYPVIVKDSGRIFDREIPDPNYDPNVKNADGSAIAQKMIPLREFDFTLQFSWQPTPLSKREEIKAEKAKAAQPATVDAQAGNP